MKRLLLLPLLFLALASAAQVSDATGTSGAVAIRDATVAGSNTATIVGTNFVNLWNSKGNKQEANTWTALQTFTAGVTNAGLKLGVKSSGDPSVGTDGQLYHNSTSDKPRYYDGVWRYITLNDGITDDRVQFGLSGHLTDDADLTFTGGNTLNAANVSVATLLSAVNLVTSTSLTVSGLTSTRIPIAGTAGLIGDDADLTFTGGNTLNAANAIITTAFTVSSLTSTRVPIAGTAGLLGDDADLTFTGGNTLAATNATVTTALKNTALTSTRVPIIGAAGLFADDSDLTFTGGNTLNTANVAVAALASTSIPIAGVAGLLDDDADLSFTGGNTLNATNAVITTAFTVSSLTSTRVPIAGTAGLLGDDADLTFTGGNTLAATNATITTALKNTALTSTRIPIIGAAGLFSDDADLTFTGGNKLVTTYLKTSAGTLADGDVAYEFTATMPTTITAQRSAITSIVTSAGSSSFSNGVLDIQYSAGYTGANLTYTILAANNAAATGTTLIGAAGSNANTGNVGISGNANATTVGTNIGTKGRAQGGDVNAGLVGVAQIDKAGKTNIGLAASAINTVGTHIGAWVTLNQTTVPTFSAALIVSNGSQTDPIAVFRDNTTTVATLADGGVFTLNIGAAVGGNSTAAGYLDLFEDTDNGTNRVRLQAPASTADQSYVLPTAVPAADGYHLSSTVAGVMSWVAEGTQASATFIQTGDPSYANITVLVSPQASTYIRVGNIMHVSGHIEAGCTLTATLSKTQLVLPIASNLDGTTNHTGYGSATVVSSTGLYTSCNIYPDYTTNQVELAFISLHADGPSDTHKIYFNYSYEIK